MRSAPVRARNGEDVLASQLKPARERITEERVRTHRILMVAAGLFTILFWFVYQGLVPHQWDPLWVRIVIGAAVALPALVSFWSGFVRRNVQWFSLVGAQLIIQWIVVLGAVNDFTVTRVVGVLLVQYCAGYLFTSVRMNVLLHALTLCGLGVAVVAWPEGWLGGTMALITVATTAIFNTMFVGSFGRTLRALVDREDELQEARDGLERRVRERTEALEREVQVRRVAERHASEANQAKSRFLANMSHELRTPLNAVIGYTELIEEDLDASNEQARGDLGRILDAATYLLAMINDILDLAKVEAGAWEYVFEEARVDELVEQATATLTPLLAERSNELVLQVEPGLPPLRTDRVRLTQVLVNLSNNAAKFTEGGRIVVRVHRSRRDDIDGLCIDVEDTGPGIPPDQLDRVFEKFVQLQAPGTVKGRGTGLGLAIGREMVRGLGGELTVQSVLGQGSTFTVWLPWQRDRALTLTG